MSDSVKVYDCFQFFNELELLELRLHILDPFVDTFVLVEADRTFSGEEKPFYFEENKSRYAPFLHKVIHLKISDYPFIRNTKEMVAYQRDQLMVGWKSCHDHDIIIFGDLDEIPSPEVITEYKRGRWGNGLAGLEQTFFYYYLNFKNVAKPIWDWARIATYGVIKLDNLTPHKMRINKQVLKIPNSGWHFSYLGGTDQITYKVRSFSHQEFNNDAFINETMEDKINRGLDIFNRPDYRFVSVKLVSPAFPEYLVKHKKEYRHFIKSEFNVWNNIQNYAYGYRYRATNWIVRNIRSTLKALLPLHLRDKIRRLLNIN